MGLSEGLSDPQKQDQLVSACTKLLDTQVAGMGGISGLAIKAGYTVVNGISPNYCAEAIARILPESLNALDPIWAEGIQLGDPGGYLVQNSDRTADALLSITDQKIQKSDLSTLRTVYSKLRGSAKKHVEEAVPGLAQIITQYTKD